MKTAEEKENGRGQITCSTIVEGMLGTFFE
jgi:hypothetical protein